MSTMCISTTHTQQPKYCQFMSRMRIYIYTQYSQSTARSWVQWALITKRTTAKAWRYSESYSESMTRKHDAISKVWRYWPKYDATAMVWAIAKVWRYSQSMPLSILTIRQSMDFQFEGKTDTLKQRPPFNCPLLADFQGHKDARLFIHKLSKTVGTLQHTVFRATERHKHLNGIRTSDPLATKSWNFPVLVTIMASSPHSVQLLLKTKITSQCSVSFPRPTHVGCHNKRFARYQPDCV